MRRARCAGLLLLGLTGCCSKFELTRRYSTLEWGRDPSYQPLAIRAAVTETEVATPKVVPAVLQLSDRGQARWVRALAQDSSVPKDLLAALGRPFPAAKMEPPAEEDACVVEKRLILSTRIVEGCGVSLADRIASLEFHVVPLCKAFTFQGWNRFGTEYGEVDLGKVNLERTNTFSAKLSPTFAGDLVGTGELAAGSTVLTKEELVLKERIVKMSGIFAPDEAVILQQSGLGLDLEGNLSLDLTLRLPGTPIFFVSVGPLDENGVPATPDKVALRLTRRWTPAYHKGPVEARVRAEYGFRHVKAGDATVIEGDDEVTLYEGVTCPLDVLLLTEERLNRMARSCDLRAGDRVLQFGTAQLGTDMHFRTEDEAKAFLKWLRSLPGLGPNKELVLGPAGREVKLFLGGVALSVELAKGLTSIESVNEAVSPR